jgi:hypothetical protein
MVLVEQKKPPGRISLAEARALRTRAVRKGRYPEHIHGAAGAQWFFYACAYIMNLKNNGPGSAQRTPCNAG